MYYSSNQAKSLRLHKQCSNVICLKVQLRCSTTHRVKLTFRSQFADSNNFFVFRSSASLVILKSIVDTVLSQSAAANFRFLSAMISFLTFWDSRRGSIRIHPPLPLLVYYATWQHSVQIHNKDNYRHWNDTWTRYTTGVKKVMQVI